MPKRQSLHDRATLVASADKSDPFAYARCVTQYKNGIAGYYYPEDKTIVNTFDDDGRPYGHMVSAIATKVDYINPLDGEKKQVTRTHLTLTQRP